MVEIHGLLESLVSDVVDVIPARTWYTACGLDWRAAVSLAVSTARWLVEPAAAPNAPVVMPILPRPLNAAPVGTIAAEVDSERSRSAIPEIVESPVSTEAVLV